MRFNPNETMLAGLPKATLQQWLTTAQSAYMQLITGGKPISVSYDGKAVTYTAAGAAQLQAFIMLLQRQLGINRGRRALRPYFR
jgi:hypothetical protein